MSDAVRFGDPVITTGKDSIGGRVVILSYELAAKLSIELAGLSPQMLILDESHYIKNPAAIRTKRLTPLCRSCPRVLLLSGTAILNRPIELWSQLMALGLSQYGTMFEYGRRYRKLHKTDSGGIGAARRTSPSSTSGCCAIV